MKILSCMSGVLALSLMLVGCGGGGGSDASPQYDNERITISESEERENNGRLKRCLLDPIDFEKLEADPEKACKISELGFIASDSRGKPSKEEIMSRVIASEPWMKNNFEKMLSEMPDDIFYMAKRATGFALVKGLKPAFFSTVTGAIYIDPDYLYLAGQPGEPNQSIDARGEYHSQMPFLQGGFYIDSNGNDFIEPDPYIRSFSDSVVYLNRLLFHELTHANDVFATVNAPQQPNDTPAIIAERNINSHATLSQRLYAYSPLIDPVLRNIANAMQWGDPGLISIAKMTSAEEVFDRLIGSYATDLYGFVDYGEKMHLEDAAMLAEEALMHIHYFATRLIVVMDNVPNPYGYSLIAVDCFDYRAEGFYGQYAGKVAHVSDRANFILEGLSLSPATQETARNILQSLPRQSNFNGRACIGFDKSGVLAVSPQYFQDRPRHRYIFDRH